MLSLRDPQGYLFEEGGHLYRRVMPAAAAATEAFLRSPVFGRLRERGLLVDTWVARGDGAEDPATAGSLLLRHERIPFPSYPFEWHPSMLADAAAATLEVALEMVEDGLTLKDATPFNILFTGSRPVFVDLLSVEPRPGGYPYWLAEAQYIRTFALPLMAYRSRGLTPRQVFMSDREGLDPAAGARMARWRDRLSLPHWLYAALPTLLAPANGESRLGDAYSKRVEMAPGRAKFIYRSTLERHHRLLRGLRPVPRRSGWSDYETRRGHYAAADLETKRNFVRKVLHNLGAGRVLDIGANLGEFSAMACAEGQSVVAIDSDLEALGVAYERARSRNLPLLPLQIDLACPSPGTGWDGRETESFIERADGHFDCVLMLAVLHHLLISGGVPLATLLARVASFTRGWLVIEHVGPDDPVIGNLLRGRDHLQAGLDRNAFEAAVGVHFSIESRVALGAGNRTLYACRKKG